MFVQLSFPLEEKREEMDGLTIGVLVFGILLLVVWLPLLIVAMVRFCKEVKYGQPKLLSEKEREQIARIEAERARMEEQVRRTLRHSEQSEESEKSK